MAADEILKCIYLRKYLILENKAWYSRTSLSLTHLFRITAYLEVKIWSLF